MSEYIKKIRTKNGDKQIDYNALANLPESDTTLSKSGQFADGKSTGDQFNETNGRIDDLNSILEAATLDVNSKTITFSSDGSIIETGEGWSKQITFGEDGTITEIIVSDSVTTTKTITFNDDGSISEGGFMSWAEIKKLNSDIVTPINHLMWLSDLKIWGEESYVWNDKEKLYELYNNLPLSMNDNTINGDVLEYMNAQNRAGEALAAVHGIESTDILSELQTMTAVAASSTAMIALTASETAMAAVLASSTAIAAVMASNTAWNAVLANSTAIAAVAASETVMNIVAANSTAMTAVAASSTSMTALTASETAMNIVSASETAMTAVAASSTAMTAVAASETVMNIVAASETALNALNTSPLIVRYYSHNQYTMCTETVSGSGIFVKVISYRDSDATTVSIDGGAPISIISKVLYAKAFYLSCAVYYAPYSTSGFGFYYIPC